MARRPSIDSTKWNIPQKIVEKINMKIEQGSEFDDDILLYEGTSGIKIEIQR